MSCETVTLIRSMHLFVSWFNFSLQEKKDSETTVSPTAQDLYTLVLDEQRQRERK